MSFTFVPRSANCSQVRGTGPYLQNVCLIINVDVNGLKGPNRRGRDTFNFHLTKNGIIPAGLQSENFLGFKMLHVAVAQIIQMEKLVPIGC